ncbi:MAG: hypothetical protein WCG92_10470 [Hyphomicrobiales bacterium]|nr:hypothetical protein [Alphaproteobacteria bacterium]
MNILGKSAIVLGLAGAMALGSMSASEARNGRNAAVAAGVGGFVAGAAIGAAAANNSYYSGGGYDSYSYEPAYSEPAYVPGSYYGPVVTSEPRYYGAYDSNYTGPWQERRLQGRDW